MTNIKKSIFNASTCDKQKKYLGKKYLKKYLVGPLSA